MRPHLLHVLPDGQGGEVQLLPVVEDELEDLFHVARHAVLLHDLEVKTILVTRREKQRGRDLEPLGSHHSFVVLRSHVKGRPLPEAGSLHH